MNKLLYRLITPQSPTIKKKNFLLVQLDALGVSFAYAVAPFLSIFLTRRGATSFQLSLLTTMPALVGFLLIIPIGQYLQNQKNSAVWLGRARSIEIFGYFLTGLIAFFVPDQFIIPATLVVWAIASLPKTFINIAFQSTMNSIAGADGRFELMSRRWSLMSFSGAIFGYAAGLLLDTLPAPINYGVIFTVFSLGGIVTFYACTHYSIQDQSSPVKSKPQTEKTNIKETISLILHSKKYMGFISNRFIFTIGTAMLGPLLSIFYVRQLEINDSGIAIIDAVQRIVIFFS